MANRMTMAELKKREAASGGDSDDEAPPPSGGGGGGGSGKPASYYTGGTSSGLNVVDPKKPGKGVVDDVMKLKGEASGAKGSLAITFWKNGFTVADGDLRSYDTAEGKVFMAHILRGQLPPELASLGSEADVAVADKRGEDYVAPPYRAYSGAGASLGGGASAPPPPTSAVVHGSGQGAKAVTLDEGSPHTSIKVKLSSGKVEVVTLNLSRTVGELQAVVASLNGSGGKAFILRAGFPPKPLDVAAATIEAAGLANSSVTQVVV